MSFESSFMTLTWAAILLLTLGLVGCLRNIRMLSHDIDARLQSPVRVKAGDKVLLPPSVELDDSFRNVALLFLQAQCRSCITALEAFTTLFEGMQEMYLMPLWKGDPHPDYADVGTPHAGEAFRALNVGLTPYIVLLDGDTVVLSSRVGSSTDINRVGELLLHHKAPRDNDRSMPAMP